VQIGDGTLRVGRGLEDRLPVALQDGKPRLDVAGMVGARLHFGNDAEIRAEEAGADVGDKFLAGALGEILVVAAEVTVEPMARARPMDAFVLGHISMASFLSSP
jgi:hypothetical protein